MEGCVYRKAQCKSWLPLLSLYGSGSQTRPGSLALRAGAGSGRGVRPATEPGRAPGRPEPAGVAGEGPRARSRGRRLLPTQPCSSRHLGASDREPLICSVSKRSPGAAGQWRREGGKAVDSSNPEPPLLQALSPHPDRPVGLAPLLWPLTLTPSPKGLGSSLLGRCSLSGGRGRGPGLHKHVKREPLVK